MGDHKVFDIIGKWSTPSFTSAHKMKVAHARATICATCPNNKELKCNGEELSIKAKNYNSTCPINKW
jgi:hypothetical protein